MEYKRLVGEFICLEEATGNLVMERVDRIQSIKKTENGCMIWWSDLKISIDYNTPFESVKVALLGVPFMKY